MHDSKYLFYKYRMLILWIQLGAVNRIIWGVLRTLSLKHPTMDDTENDEGDIQEYILSMFPG